MNPKHAAMFSRNAPKKQDSSVSSGCGDHSPGSSPKFTEPFVLHTVEVRPIQSTNSLLSTNEATRSKRA